MKHNGCITLKVPNFFDRQRKEKERDEIYTLTNSYFILYTWGMLKGRMPNVNYKVVPL